MPPIDLRELFKQLAAANTNDVPRDAVAPPPPRRDARPRPAPPARPHRALRPRRRS